MLAGTLEGLGVPAARAATVADLLVEADLRGVDSHGSHLMALYVSRIRSGHLRPDAEVTVLADDGATVRLDAGLGFGQVAGLQAAAVVAERAGQFGTATVAVREATHLGALASYTSRVAGAGRICFCFQNGPTLVPPFGGVTATFSTNPLSYAIPTGQEPMIVFDIATTTVAGKSSCLAGQRSIAATSFGHRLGGWAVEIGAIAP